ncbi:hypothetical protein Slin15195_G012100 [Septoria linicola]|uniref:Uncharacterized protein n=1 Tax=Septoria linicola TaxID=215465 RepID=A0A9Q9ANB5_9PEZI|nr:hypothetical protein Slin14017_G012120 [Septoria linicola]USW47891.1 hypothetical protein Slin15195_G012100 [Septoria linicola]
MVTTRSGESTETPTKPTTRSTTRATASPQPPTPTRTRANAESPAAPTTSKKARNAAWAHTPSNLTLIWLAISLPLVLWDAGYVLLRPHSMPGGKWHSPIWKPYALYADIDYVYGFPALQDNNPWTATQTWFNVFETTGYLVYLYWVYTHGQQEAVQGRGAPDKSVMGQLRALSESRTLTGTVAAHAVLLAFSIASLTFFKTVMYWLLEYLSGWHNIGHNSFGTLVVYWILPNGAWLVGPSYMMYVFGQEILQGLEVAAGGSSRKTK